MSAKSAVVFLLALASGTVFAQDGQLLLAKVGKKAKKGVMERNIVREGRANGKDKSKIDFDAVDISGERKTPLGTLVDQNKPDKNYDFVKIRLRWHPEMIQSASSLESGRTR